LIFIIIAEEKEIWLKRFLIITKTQYYVYDIEMDIRQAGIVYRPIVSLASVAGDGDTGKDKDARWPCFFCSGNGGTGTCFTENRSRILINN